MSERDTHFAGFSKVLWDKLMTVQGTKDHGWIDVDSDGLDNEQIEKFQQLIAQGVYELVRFIFESESVQDLLDPWEVFNQRTDFKGSLLPHIPDMTEWPDKKE